jgi:hypothetical protein
LKINHYEKQERMRWTGREAYRKFMKVLDGKPEGKRPLGRPRRRWNESGRMYAGFI